VHIRTANRFCRDPIDKEVAVAQRPGDAEEKIHLRRPRTQDCCRSFEANRSPAAARLMPDIGAT